MSFQEHLRTMAYHPQANGMIKRFHRRLKAAIKCQEKPMDRDVCYGVTRRAAWKDDLQATVAELVYGETLRLSEQFLGRRTDQAMLSVL